MSKVVTLTRKDLIDRVIAKVQAMTHEDMEYTPADLADEKQGLDELQAVLQRMPDTGFHMLAQALTTGYTIECNCGRVWEVDNDTGDLYTREHAGAERRRLEDSDESKDR